MLSISPNSIARSSLEAMLETLQRKEEIEKPKDLPPALPCRPKSTARARPPSPKRLLTIGEKGVVSLGDGNKGEMKKTRNGRVGGEIEKSVESDCRELPCVFSMDAIGVQGRMEENGGAEVASSRTREVSRSKEIEIDDNIGYFMNNKLRVWCRLRNGKWESGQIQSTSGDKACVSLSDGRVLMVSTWDILPANPDILDEVEDLVLLSYLNEPSVLYNLRHRYSHDMIYSKAGPILVAINPFKDIQLYGSEYITAYRQKLVDSPHVYATADAAYNKMMSDKVNQSIILSGESGAGKSETAKIVMQYLAAIGGSGNGVQLEVLQTNCILEAFGNAKTSRNNNSSRFGKLIEIHFSEAGVISGATIQAFLLEKSRVVHVVQGERSFHIFYQLCAGAPSELRDKLRLKRANNFYYLNQSNCLTIHEIDDADGFHKLTEALHSLKISKEDQEHIFKMLAAILWLGNISFHVLENESHIRVLDDEAITNAASLLGCDASDLKLAFSTHKIRVGQNKVSKQSTLQQANGARDALANLIYTSLFDWLVEQINRSLAIVPHSTTRSIRILDICGFESLQKNSLEQLCINYANERLQQHFIRHVFKLEQEECELDGIDWVKVDFVDNQECLDLFEKKPVGLVSLLDEESNVTKASDLTFANKVRQHLSSNSCYRGVKGGAFGVLHSAGEVLYDTSGFLEHNRDPLHAETIQLLKLCKDQLPQAFASIFGNQSHNHSVASKFKGQLFRLVQQLERTTPHFIRCIKPNSKQVSGLYENETVLEQLRCCGVLELVKIARSGYPTRLAHQEFTKRYGFVLPEDFPCQDPLSTSIAILQQFNIPPEMYQVGYKKLYFRAYQIAELEKMRNQFLQGTFDVQKNFHPHRARNNYDELKRGVMTLQSFIRGETDRKRFSVLLKVKEQDARSKLDLQLRAVAQIQSGVRGWSARRHYSHLRSSRKSADHIQEDLQHEILPSMLEELQRQIVTAESTVSEKEKENAELRDQVLQFESRWSEYEEKMRSVDDIWQKQMDSLQMGLAAAKESLGAHGSSPSPGYYGSDITSMGVYTPGGSSPIKDTYDGSDVATTQENNGGLTELIKEFEQTKKTFDDEANAIMEAKTGQQTSVNTAEEFGKLKHRFETWKKDYKRRMKDLRARLHKLGHLEGKKNRKWWGKRRKPFGACFNEA